MNAKALLNFLMAAAVIAIPGSAIAEDTKAEDAGAQACIACHESAAYKGRSLDMHRTSIHIKALGLASSNAQASADCFGCHSDDGFKAKQRGKTVDVAQKQSFGTVTCTTCHNVPHTAKYPHQLVMDVEDLCSSCHTQRAVLQGTGAKGIDDTRSFHSNVDCISCHMSDGNHLMKLIRPDDPAVSDTRRDTCTTCHKDNNRPARAKQLNEWQATYKEQMDPVQASLNVLNAALKEKPGLLNEEMKKKLNDVRANLLILAKDKSRGAHNIDFSLEIISSAAKDLAAIKASMK